ncbi:CS domain-containing protein [Mycena indigotica]|uniref:NudC domain-containing protein 1 n=1 Tax=Mycena indigotica TaxID=2126181 RepID=A0A8H6SGM4_9AGAR|nr:CS domain-containing protein [Mycena indigotica]KAF7299029.1 CS domain-containing protein [Mycena indigotica]
MFPTNKTLLNPHFEGYKLDIADGHTIERHGLQYPVTQSRASSFLSFEEVQSRITHNHLAAIADRLVYVDAYFRVILVRLTPEPSFTCIHELAQPTAQRPEYPSAIFLSPSEIFVADGAGLLYILKDTGELIALYSLAEPFRIHSISAQPTGLCFLVLSSRQQNGLSSKTAHFNICAAKISTPLPQNEAIRPLEIAWQRRGNSVPIEVAFDESRQVFLVLGESSYTEVETPVPTEYNPTPSEMAPIPQSGENLDVTKPPPYSWTQTSDSVTVAIPLPASTPTSDIKVTFSPQTLTVHIKGSIAPDAPLPHYSSKRLWATISAVDSMWTWDRAGERHYGVLTLHIEKKDEGTRWSHVFESSGTSEAEEDMDVPETLDASQLYAIRESLEKYTAALRTGEDASGLGLGSGLPSLARGEADEDVDDSVGRNAQMTWVNAHDGSTPTWASRHGSMPGRLLATEIPGITGSVIQIVLKNGVDGTVFALEPAESLDQPPQWRHTSTYSALAFVLASKTDTRFTYHVPSKAVLAFEHGQRGRAGNVYIYQAAATKEIWAKQSVFRVGEEGSLLGITAVQTASHFVLIGLTEKELVVLYNIPALRK